MSSFRARRYRTKYEPSRDDDAEAQGGRHALRPNDAGGEMLRTWEIHNAKCVSAGPEASDAKQVVSEANLVLRDEEQDPVAYSGVQRFEP